TCFGGSEAGTTGLLHDWKTVEVEPADSVSVNGFDSGVFLSFETAAERSDPIFDEVESSASHYVKFCFFGSSDDLLGHAERGADFGSREFAIFEKLHVGAGELWLNDLGSVPKQEGFVGGTGFALALAKSGEDLLLLG